MDRYINFINLKNEEELMKYMDENIIYGWIDVDGKIHDNTLEGYFTIYRINSSESVFNTGYATCIEQAKMIYDYYSLKGLDATMYCIEFFQQKMEHPLIHCFVVRQLENGKYRYFEHSDKDFKGIYDYDSVEDLFKYMDTRHVNEELLITKIDGIEEGLTLNEFLEYVHSCKNKGDYYVGNRKFNN